jgi:hypothetical protein
LSLLDSLHGLLVCFCFKKMSRLVVNIYSYLYYREPNEWNYSVWSSSEVQTIRVLFNRWYITSLSKNPYVTKQIFYFDIRLLMFFLLDKYSVQGHMYIIVVLPYNLVKVFFWKKKNIFINIVLDKMVLVKKWNDKQLMECYAYLFSFCF